MTRAPSDSLRGRLLAAVFLLAIVTSGMAEAQTPSVLNGRVETRPATLLDGALTSVGVGGDPVWLGWMVPMVDSQRDLCGQWTVDPTVVRVAMLEPNSTTPPTTRSAGPVRLEGGTRLVVLARVIDGRVDRLRTIDDECPIDAGGRAVHWLTGITAGESLRYLDTLTRDPNIPNQQAVAMAAISAIALHRDAAADTLLDRLVASGSPDTLMRQAATWLASARGAHGFEMLHSLARSESDQRRRRTFVGALGRTRQPRTPEVLLAIARTDVDPGIRADAVYAYALTAPTAALPQVMTVIEQDRDETVKRRAVSSLGLLTTDAGVPALIQLVRTNSNPVVRKEAVSTLGRATDARARAFLEELVAR